MKHKVIIALVICLISISLYKYLDTPETTTPYLRLHVIAHSNQAEDQRVKRLIRDEILSEINQLSFQSEHSCLETLANHLPDINKHLKVVLQNEDKTYPLYLQLGEFNFPTKSYDKHQVILPAGQYPALNVVLGSGQGRNWWCVLFPSLCVTAEAWQETGDTTQEIVVELKICSEINDLEVQPENNLTEKS